MEKLKLMTILGTRPEIIRLSATIQRCDRYFQQILVHTGQNYDYELNQVFFEALGLRAPDCFACVLRKQRPASRPRPTRPRSWWRVAKPKRSPSSMTITVASGTSTPTSSTVVETSICTSPRRNASMTASFSWFGMRPWSASTRAAGNVLRTRSSSRSTLCRRTFGTA